MVDRVMHLTRVEIGDGWCMQQNVSGGLNYHLHWCMHQNVSGGLNYHLHWCMHQKVSGGLNIITYNAKVLLGASNQLNSSSRTVWILHHTKTHAADRE